MDKKEVSKKDLLSVTEAAGELGYSRQHVLRLIKSGKIKARRVGRSFVIARRDLPGIFAEITAAEKRDVDKAVGKVFRAYGKAIKKLGKE